MMKTKIKKVLALLTLSLGILAIAPSDVKADTAVTSYRIINGVSTPVTVECQKWIPSYYEVGTDGSLKSRAELYVTRQEMVNSVLTLYGNAQKSDEGLISQFNNSAGIIMTYDFVGIETLNGVQVYHFSKNLDMSASKYKPEEMTAHSFKISEMNASWLANIFKGDKIRFKMPFKVAKTNGVLLEDGQTVEFTSTLDDESNSKFTKMYFWAIDSTQKSIVIDNVKPKITIKKNYISVNDDNFSRLYIDGILEDYIDEITNRFGVVIERKLEKGEHTVVAFDLYGNSRIKKFKVGKNGKITSIKTVKDRKKPTTNMKAKTYKKSVKITFKDDYGVAKATLNGKEIKNNYKVKKNGTYTLKVYDLFNNCKKVKFKIKK